MSKTGKTLMAAGLTLATILVVVFVFVGGRLYQAKESNSELTRLRDTLYQIEQRDRVLNTFGLGPDSIDTQNKGTDIQEDAFLVRAENVRLHSRLSQWDKLHADGGLVVLREGGSK